MKRLFILILTSIILSVMPIEARNVKSVKRERQKTTQEIKRTSKEIEENKKKARKSLNQLNRLEADMRENDRSIKQLQAQVDSINRGIWVLNDSIAELDNQLAAMRNKYAAAVRKMQSRQGSMSKLAFIFSSESFTQAYRRMRYLQQFSRWRARKSEEIAEVQQQLEGHRTRLSQMQDEKNHSLIQMNVAQRELTRKQKETGTLVANLKKEEKSLRAILKEKEKEAKALDRELDRLIAEQQRKAEEEQRKREQQLAEERRKKEAAERERQLAAEKAEKDKKKEPKKDDKKKQDKPSEQNQKNQKSQPPKSDFQSADADRELTGSFESNKGRLLFPVTGKYKIVRRFGRQRHADLPYVQTDNGGIDIEVVAGETVRAIFAGKVSAIFRQPGFNTIVMIRHGKYISIYANLGDIMVKTGDTVKANQTIGRVFADPDDDNRSIMHFEIRKEKEKLNPELWVK